jgi:hypothetical protein
MRHALACLLLAAFNAAAADNTRLRDLFLADQAVRLAEPDAGDVLTATPEDVERQAAVLQQIAAGALTTSADYFHAAVVFQHGATPENIALAYSLATIATRMEPTHPHAKFLTAAAWDRLMKRMGKPQWYGTQYLKGRSGRYELYPVDEQAVTDQDRARLGVPALADSRERIRKMNGA